MFLVLGNSRDSSFELLPVLVLLTCLPWIPVSAGGALSGLQEGITSRDAGRGRDAVMSQGTEGIQRGHRREGKMCG